MPLPVVRSPLGLPLGGPGLLPGPPALSGCWPEAYIIHYCGSFFDVLTLLDTYTSGARGDGAPPRFHCSNCSTPGGDGAPPRHNNRGASPWFTCPSNWQRRMGVTSLVHSGGPPLISISTIPYGRPTWDTRHGGHWGASPYFRIVSVCSCRSTLTERRTWGRGTAPYIMPSFHNSTLPPVHVGKGPGTGGPPLISVKQFKPRARGASPYIIP